MNQLILTAQKLRRIALVIVGLAVFGAVFVPNAAFAASRVDAGSAEFVTVGYGKDYGKQHGYYYQPKKPIYYSCPFVYTVRKGDTLSALARHYKTTVHALAQANRIHNPNRIFVGQRLCVPNASQPPAPPKESFCKAYHTVKYGDTLYSLARRYNTTVHKIIADNKLTAPRYLHSGQKLCIR